MQDFIDRRDAGRILALKLLEYANRSDAIVLALPRGGVPVAYEVAVALSLPLDIFIVRKLGVPGSEEFAMGAIASQGIQVLNDNVIQQRQVSAHDLQLVIERETQELARRELVYRNNLPPLNVKNKVVILVDDGIATGATMRAAVKALRVMQPSFIVIAVPVVEKNMSEKMKLIADKVIYAINPEVFYAVGEFYQDFSQTTDEEVIALLRSDGLEK